ncbi:hypothetical protein RchiOBHm_Chr7g0221561 [Rosa chinensis]|uniref:Uncharacterized protein n=1 Tax=Rosa chinensis TaxID=74649 RepID=A0A2P6PD18_ROSCH|nr:hypothetical protein RchiOBHm_Chr7g0221561 [Rosa chinensis]
MQRSIWVVLLVLLVGFTWLCCCESGEVFARAGQQYQVLQSQRQRSPRSF